MSTENPHLADTTRAVAAVIGRADRYLVCQRPRYKRHGGPWEFPGGKLRNGETLLAGARRELAEELELGVTAIGATLARFRDPGSLFEIEFVTVEALGEPVPHEHEAVRWCTPGELTRMPLAPADAALIAVLARSQGKA